jgi:hypothetical protein
MNLVASFNCFEKTALPMSGAEVQSLGFTVCGLVTRLFVLSQFVGFH